MKNIFNYLTACALLTSCSNAIYVDKRLDTINKTACEGATPHQLIEGAMPQYPKKLMSSYIEGFVVLKLDVNKKGKAENIKVVASSPVGYFEKYALNAAKQWKYRPATLNNKPVTTKNIYTTTRFCIINFDPVCKDPQTEMKKIISGIPMEKSTCEL